VVGPDTEVSMSGITKLDWELELAVVIGIKARNLSVADALSCVAGYTVANDLSARDRVTRAKLPPATPFFFDFLSQKCFDGSCPLGPWITPASVIPDPSKLGMKAWVNDELMQDSHTSRMIFDTAEQIAALSASRTLYPGDVILTGTPAGVGMGRGFFLKPGDKIRMWIEEIGELRHGIVE
jgi:2-keto-4-pentenoate hydratase/2-oxohepta-3-ene-1,7-dioic acid hydratase in catechol pathway